MAQDLVIVASDRRPSPDFHAHAHAEYDALAATFMERLRAGLLPPDEAYWWARIVCTEAEKLSEWCRGAAGDSPAGIECQYGKAA